MLNRKYKYSLKTSTFRIYKFLIVFLSFLFVSIIGRTQSYPTVYFTNVYQGDSTATYATNTNSIVIKKLLLGSDFRFVGQVPGATFTATSGNNVNGSLRYTDLNGNPFSINGTISRQDKQGSTVQSYYFYANSNHAYIFVLPTFESVYSANTTVSTSSDFSVSDINNTLAKQATLTSSFLSTCQNSSGPLLTAKVTGTVSKYEWYSNTNNSASTSSPAVLVATHTTSSNTDTYTASTSTAGTLYYFVKITLSGSVVYSNTQGITINAPPTISSYSGTYTSSQSVCQNGVVSNTLSITATVGSGTGPTYQWYKNTSNSNSGGTLISGATNASLSPPTDVAGTFYFYCVVSNSNGCTVTSNVSGAITVNSNSLNGGTIAGSTSVCTGTNSTTLTLSGYTAGSTISNWQSSTLSDFSTSVVSITNTSTSYTATNLTSTTYYRAILSNGSCSFKSASATVTVNPNTSITTQPSSAAQTLCQNSTPTPLTVSAQGGSLTYQWYSNSTNSNSGGTLISGATSSNYAPPTNTVNTMYYYVIVSGQCGSPVTSSVSGAIQITNLTATLTITSGSTINCGGTSNLSIAFTGTSPWDISYTDGTTTTTQYSIATSPYAFSVSPTSTTTYSLTSLNDGNFCTSTPSSSVTVTVTPPSAPTASITQPTCSVATGTVSVTSGISGLTFTLYNSGSTYTNTTGKFTSVASGSYSLTSTNANGCTSSILSVVVNAQPPTPTATISAGSATTFCAGGSVVLTSSSGTSYAWSTGATTQSITVTTSGSYTVTVTNSSGCSATSTATTVTVNALPTATITAGSATTFCAGGSVILTSSSGTSYAWSTGATTQSITVTTSGSYTVTVTNASGCSATSTATTVTVNALPAISVGSIPDVNTTSTSFSVPYTITTGTPTSYSIVATTPAMPSFTTIPNTAITSSPISVTIPASAANTYSFNIIIKDANSCENTHNFTLNVIDASKQSSSIEVTGSNTFTYTSNAQGPTTYSKTTGTTGDVTFKYTGTGSTIYGPLSTLPTNAGTYEAVATLGSDATYNGSVSPDFNFTINKAASTITATGTITYTYNGSSQGPATNTKTGSTGVVTYSYSGTGSTTYGPSATAPTNVGTYKVVATLAADDNYNGATSADYAFTINQAASTITATGTITYTYNGSSQGPATNTKTGSTGAVTYSYSGTGSTTYGPSATAPTNVGTYKVVATLAADDNYNGATSSDYAFTINKAASTITATGTITYTYNGSSQGPATNTKTGSTGAVTYSYSGTGSTTYGPSSILPSDVGTYKVIATLAADDNYNGAVSNDYSFSINGNTSKGNSTIAATGTITYTYTGSSQGPATNTKTGSTGAVTYSYSGTGSTTYGPSATLPTTPGTYKVVATLAADDNYNGATSADYAFTINKAASTITATGTITYTYNGSSQGPASNTKTGSTGVVTYSYSGTGSTTYGPSATVPITPGTYKVVATLAADDNYNGATSADYAFTINKAASNIEVKGKNTYTYNGLAQGPATNTKTGSTGAVTYSYSGTGSTTYGPSTTLPTTPGTYKVVATLANDDNFEGATSSIFEFSIVQELVPPIVKNEKYLLNHPSIPPSLNDLVISNPSGTVPVWCDVNAANCTTSPPKMPIEIGNYVYLLKSYDTLTKLYSNNFVYDTVTITPPKPSTFDTTFVLGVKSNPLNVGGQVIGLPNASFNYYINNNLQNGTPSLSKSVGTYTYAVSQVVNKIESDKSSFKINIIDPESIIQLNLTIDSGILQPNSTFNYSFKLIASNLSNNQLTNVTLTDNLHNTIPITSDYNIFKNATTGGLVVNSLFNSNTDIDITKKESILAPLEKSQASFIMNLIPNGYVGTLLNTATIKADTKWGTIQAQSNSASFYVKDLVVTIPEGFSPNHDGVHDNFVIIRPHNVTIDLKVFNRWGNYVYTNSNYKNEWDGTGAGNFLGQELPDGGYYYIVKAIDEKGNVQTFNGYVILKR